MNDTQHLIGKILTTDPGRDAIHIAVAPVIAKQTLAPGAHVGVNGSPEHPIGIVDPFLTVPVQPNERFWLFLYPNTITSLRHEWTHPALHSVSEIWIRDFADGVGLTYTDLMNGAKYWIEYGEYLVRGGLLEGESVPPEFWTHYQAVTGQIVEEGKQESFFSCSC